MKKVLSCLLCFVLLASVFAGCAAAPGGPAVDETLLECFGGPGDKAVESLGLTEDEMQPNGHSYITELEWCGIPMETELASHYMNEDVFGYAGAKKMFPDDAETAQTMRRCLEELTAQFGAPYAYVEVEGDGSKVEFYEDKLDEYFAYLESTERGGIQFRFSLEGKSSSLGDDGDFLDCYFLKFPEAPGELRIQFTMTWVGDRGSRSAG